MVLVAEFGVGNNDRLRSAQMSWISELARRSLRLADEADGNYSVWDDVTAWQTWGYGDQIGGAKPAAGIDIDHNTAMNCAAAMACTRAIAETLSTLPALLFEQLDEQSRRKARTNRYWQLLHDQPNPEMDATTFYALGTKRLTNRGNAFHLFDRDGRDNIIAIWPIHNSRCRPWRRKGRLLPNGRYEPGQLEYRLYMDEDKPQEYVPIESRDILNVVGWDTEDGIVAHGAVRRAKQEIALEIAGQEFSASVYGNGALPLGLIKHPSFIQDLERRENFRRDINKIHRGRENWNRVGILWDNAEWQKLGFSPEEVQALQSRTLSAKTICRYYNTPPAIIQIFDEYKFSTVEAMLKQFVMLTIRPLAVRWEKAIGTQLLAQVSDDILLEFALEGLLRGDPKTQAEANAVLRQWGIINADEWRQFNNWNPLPNGQGQAYLVPLNHAPLDRVLDGTVQPRGTTQTEAKLSKVPRFDRAWMAAAMTAALDPQAPTKALQNWRRDQTVRVPSKPQNKTRKAWHRYTLEVYSVAYRRMVALESRRAKTAATKDVAAFVDWMDDFYPKFEQNLAEALQIGVSGVRRARQGDFVTVEICAAIAAKHCQISQERLLAAVEAGGDLGQHIAACVENWADSDGVEYLDIIHGQLETANA